MQVARLFLVALSAGALAACSSSSSTPPSAPSAPVSASSPASTAPPGATLTTSAGSTGGGPVAARQDPCALFSTDQLNSAFGLKFGAGAEEQGSLLPTCDWNDVTAGTGFVAAVKKADEPNFDSDLSGPVSDSYERTSPVVGDDSVWFDPSSTDSVSLIVISAGYQYQVSIGLGASDDKEQRRTQLLALAGSVF